MSDCALADPLLLAGTGCSAASPTECNVSYVLLQMGGNHKYLVPYEGGIVHASLGKPRRSPLEHFTSHGRKWQWAAVTCSCSTS